MSKRSVEAQKLILNRAHLRELLLNPTAMMPHIPRSEGILQTLSDLIKRDYRPSCHIPLHGYHNLQSGAEGRKSAGFNATISDFKFKQSELLSRDKQGKRRFGRDIGRLSSSGRSLVVAGGLAFPRCSGRNPGLQGVVGYKRLGIGSFGRSQVLPELQSHRCRLQAVTVNESTGR